MATATLSEPPQTKGRFGVGLGFAWGGGFFGEGFWGGGFLGVFGGGVGDLHDFHFVELVEAVESAHVFTVGTSLAAETGGVGGVFDG